jgi:CPA1 family monovalent cation:H+ antiporter
MRLAEWLLLIAGLLAGAVLLGVATRRTRLPFTVVLAVVGFLAGGGLRRAGLPTPLQGEGFEQVLVFVFLPVLVFAAVLGTSVRAFVRDLGPILVLATVALGISTVLVGLAVNLAVGVALPAALLFGALISATDPVAVVAVFRELGVPRRLLTLVEGESLLNDGVAIVAFNVLLAVALGQQADPVQGAASFVATFFGGAAIGAAIGLVAAVFLPWLDRLAAAALSVAAAYGSFLLADDVLGFSGVMATVAAGLVLAGLAPSRAAQEVREVWDALWESLDYIANALLFLLIGLAIDPVLLLDNLAAIGIAVVAVLVARTLAVVPLVSFLERFAGVARVGRRNEAVLVWGGLRGGVALALALALPEELAERETLVAMTGGVVLATLLLNATTISPLVSRLGLDRPTRSTRFLALVARLSALRAARARLDELGLDDPGVRDRLEQLEGAARSDLEELRLTGDEELQVVTGRGLAVERETYQRLSDAGLLPPTPARTLLHEVDDQVDEVSMGRPAREAAEDAADGRLNRLVRRAVEALPRPAGEDPDELAYAEVSARRLAARRTCEALELFQHLPNISPGTVESALETFRRREEQAIGSLATLDRRAGDEGVRLRRRQAEALTRIASRDALEELAQAGVLPHRMAARTAEGMETAIEHDRR